MIKWIKPSGLEIETGDNDASISMAKSLGWMRAGKKEKAKAAKRSENNIDWVGGAKDGDSSASN